MSGKKTIRASRLAWSTLVVVSVLAAMLFALVATAGAATTHYTYAVANPTTDIITAASSDTDLLSAPTVTVADVLNNRLYVLDSGKNRIVWYNLTTRAHAGTFIMPAGQTQFSNPRGMALQPGAGDLARLFISDTNNNRIVVLQPTANSFTVKFNLTTAISSPKQMVWSEAAERLYVLNVLPGGTASQVRIYRSNTNQGTPAANQLMLTGTFAGEAATNSTMSANASGINVLSDNTIAVADTGTTNTANNRVLRFGLDGTYINQFGSYAATAAPRDGFLNRPKGIVRRADGYIPVIDTANHRIEVFVSYTGGEVVAEFGDPRVAGSDNTHLNSPEYGTALSPTLSVISDTGNNRLLFLTVAVDPEAPKRVSTNFDGVSCTDCHTADTRIEHEYRTRRQCLTCHEYSLRTHQIDFTMLKPKIDADLFVGGEMEMGTCGSNTTVCHSAGAVSDAGENIATHSMDGSQIQRAHRPANVDGTFAETNPCSGTAGGCHSYGSAESPFWFAESDPASAKLDYWNALTSGTASATAVITGPTDMVGTVDIRDIDPPCLVCHDTRTGADDLSFGETQKTTAIANGQPWTCTTEGCHDETGTSGVYAESQCYRTPNWYANHNRVAGNGGTMGAAMVEDASAEEPVGVSAYIQSLADMVFGGSEEASADVTILADPVPLPSSATPATRPIDIELLLSPTF